MQEYVLNLLRGGVIAEALEGIDLGETTHKKPGNTVPESIHSFSEWPARLPHCVLRWHVAVISDGHPLQRCLATGCWLSSETRRCWYMLFFFLLFSSWRWFGPTGGAQQESHSDYQQGEGQTYRWVVQHFRQHGLFQPASRLCLNAGRDFSHDDTLDVPIQVELLIKQATSHENLCQCYIGWSVALHTFQPICSPSIFFPGL